jgi:hypothetical protein
VLVLVPIDIKHANLNRELGVDVADGPDKVGIRNRGGTETQPSLDKRMATSLSHARVMLQDLIL